MNKQVKNYCFILLLIFLNITISIFNKSNDYIENINFDFNEIVNTDQVYIRGALFYSIVDLLGVLFPTKVVIFYFYVIAPIIQFYFFRKLIKNNIVICLCLYFALIFFNQDLYLLKTEIAQIFILLCLYYRRAIIFSPLAAVFHLQAITIIFGFFKNYSRISTLLFSVIALFCLSFYIEILNESSFFISYSNDKFYSLFKFSNYNFISILLIFLYSLISTSRLKTVDYNSVFLERFIDMTIIVIILFHENIVVANRLLDFLWIFIIIYIGLVKKIEGIKLYFIIISTLYCILWSVKFFFEKIVYF